jgi:membrane protease YdiL (CAAX protease family)
MSDEIKEILLRIVIFPVAVLVAVIVLYLKKLPIRDNLGLKFPTRKEWLFWFSLYIPVVIFGEAWYFGFGLNEGRNWEYPLAVMIIRAIGIIILAPISEELLFRGVIFKRIADSRLGPISAVILTTVIFTAVHFQYGIMDRVTIFVDSLFWGWVRYKTGSAILPAAMHMFSNTIAVIEFIWLNRMF